MEINYNTFQLCKNVVDGYESRLNDYELALDQEEIFYSWPGYEHDRNALHHARINLQILCGYDSQYKNQPHLQTLEDALRNTNLEEPEIKKETENCRKYERKAYDLGEKSFSQSDRALDLRYKVLTAKQRRGEILTEREKAALEFIYDIADANH